ncbi:hypothetical protein ABZ901_03185 [Actinacidiphila alni]|uniref:hypothetical protein n=1 Tax=Actinacidiphila alni TaxID=380248 RepID=UPI00340E6B56
MSPSTSTPLPPPTAFPAGPTRPPRSRTLRRRALSAALGLALVGFAAGVQTLDAAPARAATTQVDSAVIGWDGDKDAAIAHRDGSFDIRDGKNTTARFGIYNNPGSLQWTNAGGYYPALVTTFQRDNTTVTITNFGDKVTIGGHDYVAVYSRVTVANHDTVAHTEDPAPSSGPIALNSAGSTVQPGRTVAHDYVVAVDRFGATYGWPSDSSLTAAGSYDAHYAHMTAYWDGRLGQIAQLGLPDPRLVNAYKAGMIYGEIVKDGTALDVGENGYDQVWNHDLIGILVNRFAQGDLADARTQLTRLDPNDSPANYDDGHWTFPWPWAVYLQKTGDTAFVQSNFGRIRTEAHRIQADATGPGGVMKATNDIDSQGYWTVDNAEALMGLAAYRYVAAGVGDTAEANWAQQTYTTLLNAVNAALTTTINAHHLSYIPCALDAPNDGNACGQQNNANWAALFLFGRWNWDGYLFGAQQNGPMATMVDATYDNGFARLAGLPAHTYGGYTGFSTGYNAGYGEAGLASADHRAEGVYDYQFMITNSQSGPFSWWEGIPTAGTTNWSPGTHATAGTGSSPHMWGQANASKVLLDSLVAEKADGQVVVGRGVPTEWLRSGATTSATNVPIAGGHRMGATVTSSGSTVTLTLSGDAPAGGVSFQLPSFAGNIASATAGRVNSAAGTVTLAAGTTSTTVTLVQPPAFHSSGGLDLNGYCTSIGDTGGVSLDGTTAYDWHCVAPDGSHVSMDMDDACTYGYPYTASVFSRTSDVTDPASWACWHS